MLIKYYYGKETFSLQPKFKDIFKAVKNFPQIKHACQLTSLQKLLKALQIAITKN